MVTTPETPDDTARSTTVGWRFRLAFVILSIVAIATVFFTNRLLTDRFTETTRNRAELRVALYSGNLLSELRQNAIVPQLLARDPALIGALNSADYQLSTQRLISFVEEIGAANLILMDSDGRVVAATDRNVSGQITEQNPISLMRVARMIPFFPLPNARRGDMHSGIPAKSPPAAMCLA